MKPTEGPYTVEHWPDILAYAVVSPQGYGVAICRYVSKSEMPIAEANARLLAKSWEMRQVICDMLIGIEYSQDRARAILREIQGDSQ